jgi:hypothetical protein
VRAFRKQYGQTPIQFARPVAAGTGWRALRDFAKSKKGRNPGEN